jgi:hypothetical protein
MPVQLVKLDRMLLDDVGIDLRATALARSVVSMARDLGLQVVAEGMEDMATVRLLRDLGAYAGQGFALSPALPADQMARVLAGPPIDLGPSDVDGLAELDPESTPRPEPVHGPCPNVGPASPSRLLNLDSSNGMPVSTRE